MSELNADFSLGKLGSYSLAELNDRSAALFVSGRYAEGLKVAKHGVAVAKTAKQRAAFHALAAQQLAALGEYEQAGQEALLGSREDPDNKLLAAYRIAHFEASGNTLQAKVARDHLRTIDPEFDRKPVIEPATATLIVALVTALINGAVHIYQAKRKADNERLDLESRILAARDAQKFIAPALGTSVALQELAPVR